MSLSTPVKSRPPPGEQGSTPFRSASANRFRSSLVPMNRPSAVRSAHPTSKVSANSTYGRDLFRTSTPQTGRTIKFAPNLPAAVTKATPSGRKFAHKISHGGMSSIPSTEPFKMRIPSPDPDLSGEALSKQVPDDPNRTGTIYADQFLAHKCPPDFDDLQRRQFFCVLDLRRLKYAADEIFVRKDWKLNIMNFAKEYEKSRGMIMLRYGLYEFKNVKPSEEVLKRWRAAHGLPDPETERTSAPSETPIPPSRRTAAPNTVSTKRKAEEDLAPKDNALMASTANQNKRRNVKEPAENALTGPAPFKKSKRKVEETDEPDENQPNKLQKPTPAKSKFESILDKASSGGSLPPLKRAPLTPFGSQKFSDSQNSNLPNKWNPFAAPTNGLKPADGEAGVDSNGSILSSHKIGSVPSTTTGIFSYLSESSANSSSNENDNAEDGDTDSESEEEADGQEPAPNKEPDVPAAATNTDTPTAQKPPALYSTSKPTEMPSLFGSLTKPKPADLTSKGGLFGRVQMGTNGQPLRATPDSEEQRSLSPVKQPEPAAEKEQKSKTPAKQPGDYTFNPATTPISFSQPAAAIPQTPAAAASTEEAKGSSNPEDASTAKPPSLFGASAPANPAFQPTAQSLFGSFNKSSSDLPQTQSNGVTSSLFSGQKPAPTASNPFNPTIAKSLFGGVPTTNGTDLAATKEQRKSPVDSTTSGGLASAASTAKAPETPSAPQPASIFGASRNTNATPQPTTLFGGNAPKAAEPKTSSHNSQSSFGTNGNTSASSLFGASQSTSLFGSDKTAANGPDTTKSVFDAPKQVSASFTFGASRPETNETNSGIINFSQSFSQGSTVSGAPAKSLFSSSTATPPFGNGSTTPAGMFGSRNGDTAPSEKKDSAPAPQSSIFGNAPSTAAPIFTFGAQATPATHSPQAPSTPIFSGAGISHPQTDGPDRKRPAVEFGNSATPGNPTPFTFGQASSDSSFTFTAGGNGQSINNPFASSAAPSTPMFGGQQPSTPAPSSSFTFSFGQQAPSTPNPPPASQGNSTLFGASSHGGNAAPSFSFTSATPQGTPNLFGSKSTPAPSGGFGGFLQTGGEFSAGASSPFPAPSSIGTTPVSGTPEPQSQHGDGEEGPQEQISLTDGGPGEEDEVMLHEVRAKAIKYVPVVKGSDEEEEKKSPWSTQGVGPLRVLKNKSTGTVRVLLRAEPRGHIAMNKALLSDVEYKAKDKTVNFVASSDSGLGLETWVLQVKKPDFARQLTEVLEANKSANKK